MKAAAIANKKASKYTFENHPDMYIHLSPEEISLRDKEHKKLGYISFEDLCTIVTPIIETPILPRNCIYYKAFGPNTIYIIEDQPGIKKYRIEGYEQIKEYQHPYMYYVCYFIGKELKLSIFVSEKRITSLNDPCVPFKFLNSKGYYVCLGDVSDLFYEKSKKYTPYLICNNIIQYFWDSGFNDGLGRFGEYGKYTKQDSYKLKIKSNDKHKAMSEWIKDIIFENQRY